VDTEDPQPQRAYRLNLYLASGPVVTVEAVGHTIVPPPQDPDGEYIGQGELHWTPADDALVEIEMLDMRAVVCITREAIR